MLNKIIYYIFALSVMLGFFLILGIAGGLDRGTMEFLPALGWLALALLLLSPSLFL